MNFNFHLLVIYFLSYFSILTSTFFLISLLEEKRINKKIKKYPKISVLIPAHNEEENIIQTLDSIGKIDYPKKLEVIVVDDGSTDNTYKVVKKYGKKVKIYRKKQGGKASAINFGISKCKGEYIFILDADCVVEKDALKKMVKYLNEKVIAVIPSIKVLNKKNFWEKMQEIEYAIGNFSRKIIWTTSSMYMVPGAPLIKADFLKKNKFDEGNLTEDLEMGFKILSKRYEIAHATEAIVYTRVPNSFKKLMSQRIRWSYGMLYNSKKYGYLFGLKHGDLSVFVLPIVLAGIAISCFLLIYTLSSAIYSFAKSLYYSSLIGYEVTPAMIDFQLSNLSNTFLSEITYFSLILFILGLTFYFISQKNLKEKFSLHYFFYILIYGWFLIIFNSIATLYFILGKKPKW